MSKGKIANVAAVFILLSCITASAYDTSKLRATATGIDGLKTRDITAACTTAKNLQELMKALATSDRDWAIQIPGCFTIEENTEIEIVDFGVLSGINKIRVRERGQRPMELYLRDADLTTAN